MATIREKRHGVWEVRVFTVSDARGRPTQLSRTVHGGKRDAQRLAAELESSGGKAKPAGRWPWGYRAPVTLPAAVTAWSKRVGGRRSSRSTGRATRRCCIRHRATDVRAVAKSC